MSSRRIAVAVAVLVFGPLLRAESFAITNVTVIDTIAGIARPDVNVVVRDGRIFSVGTNLPEGVNQIDGRGKFVIPGLFDMHVHLSWTRPSALPLLIANGVTTVRDLGGTLGEIDRWRADVADGVRVGPRIYRAGPILNGQQFNKFQMVSGNPEETRGVVHALKVAGVDFIKVHRRMVRESYFAALDEAKKQGLDLVGHIPMTVAPEEAIDAGQAVIEHVATLFEGTFASALPKDADLAAAVRQWRESGAAATLFARFVKNRTVLDPTLSPYAPAAMKLGPLSRYTALSLRTASEKNAPLPDAAVTQMAALYDEFKKIAGVANRAGVTLVTGTDIATAERVPGFMMHDELVALVESGLTPMQVLQAATINSARVLHQGDELGSIEPAKAADLVLLDADPLADIHNAQRITAVVVNGKLFTRADLDKLLRDAEEMASRE